VKPVEKEQGNQLGKMAKDASEMVAWGYVPIRDAITELPQEIAVDWEVLQMISKTLVLSL
jgi:hypothetical protein